MKSGFYAVAALVAGLHTFADAQITVNDNGTISCPATGSAFCAGDSLSTNIIVRCPTPGGQGQPGNCNDNLAGVPPVGVKLFAPCYQTSPTAGDAACSYNGIAYPDSGASYAIPGASGSSSAGSAAGTGSPTVAPYGNGTTTKASGSAAGTGGSSSSSTTVITVGPGSTTTGAGFTITGGSSGSSTITTVVPASETSGSSATGSGSSATTTLQGSDASRSGFSHAAALIGGSVGMMAGVFALL